MQHNYDDLVRGHYDNVADECGLSSVSTMADEIVRELETEAILGFVERVGRDLWVEAIHGDAAVGRSHGAEILDVGCGNGYTLKRLASHVQPFRYTGIEVNDKLRALACQQVQGMPNVSVISGDLRVRDSIEVGDGVADVVICQRVLINLLDGKDQQKALDTIVRLTKRRGYLLFIEACQQGLVNLNEAREQFGLEPIKPAVHNRYLPEGFFAHEMLAAVRGSLAPKKNMFSTHYYISRVLHEILRRAAGRIEGERNSHFVKFMSRALPEGIGDYSPIQIHCYQKAA